MEFEAINYHLLDKAYSLLDFRSSVSYGLDPRVPQRELCHSFQQIPHVNANQMFGYT